MQIIYTKRGGYFIYHEKNIDPDLNDIQNNFQLLLIIR